MGCFNVNFYFIVPKKKGRTTILIHPFPLIVYCLVYIQRNTFESDDGQIFTLFL